MVFFSETYVSNSTGVPGAAPPDYMSMLGFNSDVHEHSRRVTLDANYNFTSDFYANGTVPTQIYNYLQALGNVDVIPEYLNLDVRAFAQPAVTSNFGVVTEGGREVPGGYTNAYGYTASPDLKFRFGDFAVSQTIPSYGQVFFEAPPGTTAANTIPSLGGAVNATIRSLTEEIDSGTDFSRLNWKLIGEFSETAQPQNLLSEKSGIVQARYALDYEWSLLGTAGYDAIGDTVRLSHKLSGPVALAGLGLTLGKDFSLQIEAGDRYNSLSFDGNLRYDLSAVSKITASATDSVQTPGGQLLGNLSSLTALPNGTLTSANDVLANGTAPNLTAFNLQSPGSSALNQFVLRYQIVNASFIEEFQRTEAILTVFGTRMMILTPGVTGSPTGDSWGVQLFASRNMTPLLRATLGGTYEDYQQFGERASIIGLQGEMDYSLSRKTNVFLRSDYFDRLSSQSLLALSPLSGNVSGFSVTLGISHAL